MHVVVEGLLCTYQDAGKGKTIVCLHGWGDSSQTFAGLSAMLSNEFRVLALDLPGFGGSEMPKETWGINNYATFIAAWLKKINVNKIYAIVGHSNGGAIAISGLANKVMSAEKLVLLSSAGVRNQKEKRKFVLKAIAKTGKAASKMLPDATQRRLRGRFYDVIGSDYLKVPHMRETFKKVVASDVQANAAELKIDTILIYGEQDIDTPLMYGELLHRAIKGSRLEIVKGAGHFVHHDARTVVSQHVLKFLEQRS